METKQSSATKETEGGGETCHPHSSKEYVEWMAGVWKANHERNKMQ